MDRERLDRWCERALLTLVLAILIIGPLANGAFRLQDYLYVKWLAAAALLTWGARVALSHDPRILALPVIWPILAFLGYALFRYATADIEFVARQEFIKILVGCSLLLLITSNLRRTEQSHIIALALIALASLIAAYGVWQYLTDSDRVWHFIRPDIYAGRGSGTYICPNHFAGFLEMLLPLSICYVLTSRFSTPIRVAIACMALTIFAGIIVSLSRGAWMATGGSLFVLLVWMLRQRAYRTRALLVVGGIGLTAGAFITTANLTPERQEAFRIVDRTEDLRFRLWNPAIDMWLDHLWIGVGPDHFNERFPQYRSSHDQAQRIPDRAHNDYINTLADWGIIGAALVSLVWLVFFRSALQIWVQLQSDSSDPTVSRQNEAALILGSNLGLVALLIHSLVDFNMHVPANALLAATLMALVTRQIRLISDRYWIPLNRPSRTLLALLLAAAAGYLGIEAARQSRELLWSNRAELAPRLSREQISALKNAFAAENRNSMTAYQIGEAYRAHAWTGANDYRIQTTNAMRWLRKSIELNPWNAYGFMRYGMCLDWLGEHELAESQFLKAETLDPNGYHTLAHVGWHYVQTQDYLTAREFFRRSLRIYWIDNPIAKSYLQIVDQRLKEDSSDPLLAPIYQ